MRWTTRAPATKWHYWFAWRPVQVRRGIWVWGETIERRRIYPYATSRRFSRWYYRIPQRISEEIPVIPSTCSKPTYIPTEQG